MHIGIDVGGTNTDAVLMEGATTLAGVKHSTTPDVTTGIVQAIEALRAQHAFTGPEIRAVMIGTTHFINALVQAKRLAPTAALRLGLPATRSLPPMIDWPQPLVEALSARTYLAHGGYEFDGRPISPLDPEELRTHARDMLAHGIRSVAISSVFSPVNHDLEVRAAEIVRAVFAEGGPDGPTDVAVSLSHEIGRIGLLERENATIINAALSELAGEIVDGLTAAARAQGITAPIYLSQNDGTLMDEGFVRSYPVATFASGPTNSMRGAAVTSGLTTCAVVDVGGTTADVGLLVGGFPRETAGEVKVAGVRTNFRMPDVLSIGIGGGSLVDLDTGEVGPESVGYRLTTEALVFGGSTLTATDIAVAAGRADIGDATKVAHLDPVFVQKVLARIAERVAEAVDRMRTSPDPIPVVAVGGGSILLPDELPIFGRVHRPENYSVANAIGASIAQVGGEIDKIIAIEPSRRQETIAAVKQEAVEKAVAAGARAETVDIVDFDEVPIPYLPGNATRIRVKAVGDLEMDAR
ncbi:hydantoinase/oxoprolinase family protein [Nakamurella flavida]|uniref:Hydantoinase/oxoprolinase family protein n=1 Tax=Nakamurella flavida TaxID=363630 RepID=A0A938YPD0_9ACTN|nr:hydantoinase/oxoprolinase family protein [Nakamurella flavida]MBM9476530.1 hydantoinase/oxoprolinase family protein [Nakamurella flavida]MDP9779032.1 N-methylhydantoinase A/oxoprolinase/acetone carboxylase beta subunit [Nakamurella flavida]